MLMGPDGTGGPRIIMRLDDSTCAGNLRSRGDRESPSHDYDPQRVERAASRGREAIFR